MDTATIRQQLYEYIEQVNDKKIEGLYLFVEDEISKQHVTLSEEQVDFLDEEREKHLKGESKSYSWEEAKEIIRNKKSRGGKLYKWFEV
jgi:hypothetical protein